MRDHREHPHQQRPTTPGSVAGEVAVVSGAGSGVERTTALAFAREGAIAVVADLAGHEDTAPA